MKIRDQSKILDGKQVNKKHSRIALMKKNILNGFHI